MRLVTPILLIIFLLLQHRLWFGDNSVADYVELSESVESQKLSNEVLMKQNELLLQEINGLKSGTDAVEERARNELGMIQQGEVFYRLRQSTGTPNNERE
ncbi:cell division protein FtsB [Echinimonas agarilytica]|uniref:Cell division protein FtsB n=1 Tax=Echinimonas agarilytica TaxID=1215918 RepID=A0AA42B6L6_9GAMM|nr:cell division protein FtsB [Echinimonas agarilytica]MCM2678834.1 cell division protein FtsB [Echinimonas agarilytica]